MAVTSSKVKEERTNMTLTTSYLGMTLKNPIVASSSPLSHNVDSIRRLEDAGACRGGDVFVV